ICSCTHLLLRQISATSLTLLPYTTLFRSHAADFMDSQGQLVGRVPVQHELVEIVPQHVAPLRGRGGLPPVAHVQLAGPGHAMPRSEEHTSELQSRENLVCRLLLEKKKQTK